MSYPELILMALSLCLDTFTVSLAGGLCGKDKLSVGNYIKIFLFFAFFQTLFLAAGWFLGSGVVQYIVKAAPWIAFILLSYVGINMILDATRKKKDNGRNVSIANTRHLVLLAVATSIDAFAVGLSLAMLHLVWQKILAETVSVFVFTALASVAGLLGGKCLGHGAGRKPMIFGGIILILIGIKILLEYYF